MKIGFRRRAGLLKARETARGGLLGNPILSGAAALAVVIISALVAASLYTSPPGQKIVTFYTEDAASIHPGDDVRIAGVAVGKVKDLALETKQVRVRVRVDNDAFIGDQSQVQVRMLTVVGGYFVNIVSLGDTPLGAQPIPVERATMPYSLMRTLADTTKITKDINPKPINESLDQLQKGFSGANVKTLSAIIDAGNNMMATVDRQRGQVTAILNLSDEYIHGLSNFGDELRGIVRKASILEQTLVLYSQGFGDGLEGLGNVLDSLSPVVKLYLEHHDYFFEKVRRWQVRARTWADRLGVIIRSLRLVRNKIERVLDAQSAPPELLATDMCFPVPGKPC